MEKNIFSEVLNLRHESIIQRVFLRVSDEVFGKQNVESFVIKLYANNMSISL